MKLMFAPALLAMAAAVAPPRIELNLEQMGSLTASKRTDTDWTERCPASARTNAGNCPFPQATAFDHNNNEIPVTESVYRVTIVDGKEQEVQVKKDSSGKYPVKWSATGIYLFKYAATDAVGNDAEHIVFELVLDDVVKPTINCAKFPSTNACPAGSGYDACVEVYDKANAKASLLPSCTVSDLVTPSRDIKVKYSVFGCSDLQNPKSMSCKYNRKLFEGSKAEVDQKFLSSAANFNQVTSFKIGVTAHDNAGIFGAHGEDNFAIQDYTVGVVDTEAPQVSVVGSETLYMECGTSFMRADEGKGAYIDIAGKVVTSKSDDSRFYHARVVDGQTQLDNWKDAGAKVVDNYDCNLANGWNGDKSLCPMSAHAATNLNVHQSGEYKIVYEASDSSGNDGTATRTVNVIDDIAPQVSLIGPAVVEYHQKTQKEFNDPGVTVKDNCDNKGDYFARNGESFVTEGQGSITSRYEDASGKEYTWGELPEGTFSKIYTVKDRAGNTATARRTIKIVDHEKPILKLVCPGGEDCDATEYVEADHDEEYTDQGATCRDYVHGNLNRAVRSTGDIVKRNVVGTYHVTYTCKDPSGNHAVPITRTIVVRDAKCPEVKLAGASTMKIEAGFPFSDPGAKCTDSFDTSLECTKANGYHSYGNNVNYAKSFATSPSCSDIKSQFNGATSGDYTIQITDAKGAYQKASVYCDMDYARTYLKSSGTSCAAYGMAPAAWTGQAKALVSAQEKLPATYFMGGKTTTFLCSFKNENANGAGKIVVESNTESFTRANSGSFVITYAATDATGNMAACADGLCACPPTRTVLVSDTLPPVISLRVGEKLVARSRSIEEPLQYDTAHIAAKDGGNPFLSLMAESTTSVNGWAVAAVGSLVMGVALLSYSRKSSTSVPV